MISFIEWLKNKKIDEVGGATGAIYDGSKSPDFQWEGSPESMGKKPKCMNFYKTIKSKKSKNRSTN
jgi:hypothetical protein